MTQSYFCTLIPNKIKIIFFVQLETILGRLNPNKLIDMTAIINARLMTPADFLWSEDIMGLRLVADGANQFKGRPKVEFKKKL